MFHFAVSVPQKNNPYIMAVVNDGSKTFDHLRYIPVRLLWTWPWSSVTCFVVIALIGIVGVRLGVPQDRVCRSLSLRCGVVCCFKSFNSPVGCASVAGPID